MSLSAVARPPAPLSEAERPLLLSALLRRFNHDLRTPLNTLSGWSELLRQGANDAQRVRHAAQVMGRSVREQTLLLEDYADDVRTVLGELRLQTTPLAAGEVAAAAAERLGGLTALHGVELEAEPLPPTWCLHGERRCAVRLLYRMLRLMVRQAPPGSVLRQRIEADAEWLRFTVEAPAETVPDEAARLDAQLLRLGAAVAEGGFELHQAPGATRARLWLPRAADARPVRG